MSMSQAALPSKPEWRFRCLCDGRCPYRDWVRRPCPQDETLTTHAGGIMAGSHLPSLFTRRSDGLGSLLREIEKTFEDFSRRSPLAGFGDRAAVPKIDVSEGRDGVEVTAELPGCEEKDIDITLSEGVLTIRGKELARGRTQLRFLQPVHPAAVRPGFRQGRSEFRQRRAPRQAAQAVRSGQEGKENRGPPHLICRATRRNRSAPRTLCVRGGSDRRDRTTR
jgi:hypothetical protein